MPPSDPRKVLISTSPTIAELDSSHPLRGPGTIDGIEVTIRDDTFFEQQPHLHPVNYPLWNLRSTNPPFKESPGTKPSKRAPYNKWPSVAFIVDGLECFSAPAIFFAADLRPDGSLKLRACFRHSAITHSERCRNAGRVLPLQTAARSHQALLAQTSGTATELVTRTDTTGVAEGTAGEIANQILTNDIDFEMQATTDAVQVLEGAINPLVPRAENSAATRCARLENELQLRDEQLAARDREIKFLREQLVNGRLENELRLRDEQLAARDREIKFLQEQLVNARRVIKDQEQILDRFAELLGRRAVVNERSLRP